jgi:hypothetical protein
MNSYGKTINNENYIFDFTLDPACVGSRSFLNGHFGRFGVEDENGWNGSNDCHRRRR